MDAVIRAGKATHYKSIRRLEESGFNAPRALRLEHVLFVSCGSELAVSSSETNRLITS